MPSRTSLKFPALCLMTTAWITATCATAQEASPSLYEKRLGILKGTSKGIVVWGAEPSAPAAPGAAADIAPGKIGNSKADAPSPASPTQAPSVAPSWSKLPPPSGRSMADAQRLGAVGGGIPLPTARKGSPAEADPTTKP